MGSSGMMVLLERQVHLQKDVGAASVSGLGEGDWAARRTGVLAARERGRSAGTSRRRRWRACMAGGWRSGEGGGGFGGWKDGVAAGCGALGGTGSEVSAAWVLWRKRTVREMVERGCEGGGFIKALCARGGHASW
jgi:hypothetical protein